MIDFDHRGFSVIFQIFLLFKLYVDVLVWFYLVIGMVDVIYFNSNNRRTMEIQVKGEFILK